MGAVWMVRSRQLFTSFRFWLALFGYNPRDHSFSQKLYLVYAAIFYLLWTFAVLSLFAGGAAQLLAGLQNLLGPASPGAASGGITSGANIAPAASLVGWLGLVIWWLIAAYTAARRSPLNFSEEDAYLICQTPADRRAVALAWLVGQWPASLLPIGTLAIILGFSLVEGAKRGFLTTADIPFYLLSGLRSVSIIVPLQLGLLSLAWTPGVIRLRRGRERAWVRWVSPAIGLILLLVWLASNTGEASLLSALSQSPLAFLAAPLMYPLQAALGLVAWPNGGLAAIAWAAVGLLVMLLAATRLNLSRAAQESRGQITLVQTLLAGDARQVEVFKMQQKLGTQRQPSSWLTGQAWEARSQKRTWLSLVLKDLAQSARTNPLTRLWNWLSTFLIGAGLVLSTALRSQDWALAAILLVYWSLQIGNQATKRLRDDLALWSLLRPLPLGYKNLIAAEVMRSWIEASLVSWLGLALGVGMYALIRAASAALQAALPAAQPLLQPGGILVLILLAPILVALAIFGAALDVLRQSKSSNLLSGYAPQPGVLSMVLGGGAVLISAVLAYSLAAFSPWLAVLAPLASAGLARLLWEAATQRYAGIK
jgi:hypothetical protein